MPDSYGVGMGMMGGMGGGMGVNNMPGSQMLMYGRGMNGYGVSRRLDLGGLIIESMLREGMVLLNDEPDGRLETTLNLAWSADERPMERRPVVPGAGKSQSGLVYHVSETAMYMLEAGPSSLCRISHPDLSRSMSCCCNDNRLLHGSSLSK